MSYLVTTADGITHQLPALDAAAYTSSANTAAALADAIAAGNYELLPEQPPEPEPNPSAFRAALASAPSWLTWAEQLSSVGYTNLATAAAQGNWAEAQAIYQRLATATPPPPVATGEWQQLATDHAIPITF